MNRHAGLRAQGSGIRAQGAGLVLLVAALTAACAQAPMTDKTPKAGSEMSRAVLDPYLKIQQALADDSMDGVTASAGTIATAATSLGAPAMKIDTTAVQLASAADIEDARQKFGALSEAIDAYMTGLHLTPPEGVKVAVCPMVHKPWLQADATINNPYYGKSMQTCGSFR
jgi:HPt (histidine-containing phosphotransfer) domain-containing protein